MTAGFHASVAGGLEAAVVAVTKAWREAKRRADREGRARQADIDRLSREAPRAMKINRAAFSVMREAYLKASAGGRLPANVRQIMYAARPLVLRLTDGKCWSNSDYFTQTLLTAYLEAHPDEAAEWDVVYDARGHLAEPHRAFRELANSRIDLGTLEVRDYVRRWAAPPRECRFVLPAAVPTCGPRHRYRHALFVEKEGFNPLLEGSRIAERFDLAIMSTKGMSTTAARELVERLSDEGARILVLRDFDKAGFSIVNTLRTDTRRYSFERTPDVVDLGLRLADVRAMGLESEPVTYRGDADPRINLRACGATKEERAFLVSERAGRTDQWTGQRVELNAMDSQQLLDWLEEKLVDHGVEKVVPDDEVLAAAYRRARRLARIQRAIDGACEGRDDETAVPADLAVTVRTALTADPALSWDEALWHEALGADGPA